MDFDGLDVAALRRRSCAKWARCPADVLPAWVADMDFDVAEPIRRALGQMVASSDLGYPISPDSGPLPAIFATRMERRFGWTVDPERIEVLTDVVQGLQFAIEIFSEAGQAVVCPDPIYPPFLDAVRSAPRAAVWQRFVRTDDGYRIDLDDLRAGLTPNTRMLLVCNPHNPTGHVLGRTELEALAAIALERDLVVVSDEIHADLVFSGAEHVPIASLGPELAARTITLTSATKAFNIAGLRCAVAVFGSAELQRRFSRVHPHARGGIGAPGLAATIAAWSECDSWLDDVLRYLEGNRALVAAHVTQRWPRVAHVPPEATYLAWLDMSALGLEPSAQRFFVDRARVALSAGEDFGVGGRGHVRLNFATSRAILREILARMDAALEI